MLFFMSMFEENDHNLKYALLSNEPHPKIYFCIEEKRKESKREGKRKK